MYHVLWRLSTKMECDYLYSQIKNGHIRKNLTQNGELQRHSWERKGRRRRRILETMLAINEM